MDEQNTLATESSISRFEKRIGASLPTDYRQFLMERNGGQPEERRCSFATRTGRAVINVLHTLDADEERFDLLARWERSRGYLPSEVLPVGYDDGGGVIAIGLSGPHAGEVWFTSNSRPGESNPRVDWFDRRDVMKLAPSFADFAEALGPLT